MLLLFEDAEDGKMEDGKLEQGRMKVTPLAAAQIDFRWAQVTV